MRMKMLGGPYLAVLESENSDQFRQQIIRFAHSLDFKTASAVAVIDRALSTSEFYGVDNTPPGFLNTYHDELIFFRDPVMQHCKRTSIPIVWDQNTYIESRAAELWEHQASYGYHSGIAFGLHLPGGRHFGFGVDTDRQMPSSTNHLTKLVAQLQLFAIHAQEAALRVLVPPEADDIPAPNITPRELEALRWTMDGKTAHEIGELMKLADRTVVFHLRNAMRKLNCNSKYQAVLTAIRLGLLK